MNLALTPIDLGAPYLAKFHNVATGLADTLNTSSVRFLPQRVKAMFSLTSQVTNPLTSVLSSACVLRFCIMTGLAAVPPAAFAGRGLNSSSSRWWKPKLYISEPPEAKSWKYVTDKPAVNSGEKGTPRLERSGLIVTPEGAPAVNVPASIPGAYSSYSWSNIPIKPSKRILSAGT